MLDRDLVPDDSSYLGGLGVSVWEDRFKSINFSEQLVSIDVKLSVEQ